MADDFHWAERQRFLTSFCLVASSVHSARRCQPSRVIFLRHRSCRLFPLVEGILGSRLDEGCRVPAAMERWRNTVGEGGCISRRVCGLQSVFTSSMGCHHSALPSREKSTQAASKERRTGRCLRVSERVSHFSAGFRLPQLFCYDSFALIGLFEYLMRG